MPRDGFDASNFMVGAGGTSLYDWQIQIIIDNNRKLTDRWSRFWSAYFNAIQTQTGRLGPDSTYYAGNIYASGFQAAAVAAWDRMYTGHVPAGGNVPPVPKKKN